MLLRGVILAGWFIRSCKCYSVPCSVDDVLWAVGCLGEVMMLIWLSLCVGVTLSRRLMGCILMIGKRRCLLRRSRLSWMLLVTITTSMCNLMDLRG